MGGDHAQLGRVKFDLQHMCRNGNRTGQLRGARGRRKRSLWASFGRYGIPFDVVYGPGAPDGVTLPELLTEDAVLTALNQAAGKPAS